MEKLFKVCFPFLLFISEDCYSLVLLVRLLYTHYLYSEIFYWTRSRGFNSLTLREVFHVKISGVLVILFLYYYYYALELVLLVVY